MKTLNYTDADYQEDLKICNWVYSRFFRGYKELRDDLIQEGLISLWQARKKYVGFKSQYSTYACFCSSNAMRMCIRKMKRYTESENDCFIEEQYMPTITRPDDKAILNLVFANILKNLNDVDKRIIVSLLAGFTTTEIGKRLGCSHQYVSKRFKPLKKIFNDAVRIEVEL